MTGTPAEPAGAEVIAGHLAGYTDPAELAAHLRGEAHAEDVRADREGNLPVLAAMHRIAHTGGV